MCSEPTPGPLPDEDVVEGDYEEEQDEDDYDGLPLHNRTKDTYDSQSLFATNQSQVAVERKRKREHGVISHFGGDASSWDSPEVSFKVKIQHHVTAYVTWPEKLSPCDYSIQVIGYVLRYYKKPPGASDQSDAGESQEIFDRDIDYKMQNLSDNFVVLEGLEPDSTYGYQVKYVLVNGPDSDWSREAELSTHYVPPT